MQHPSRREVLQVGLALPVSLRLRHSGPGPGSAKKLLVLGGTRFLGPPVVRAAQAAGWEVTLFNRGKSNPGLFKDLEQIDGDRDAGTLDGLKGRKWDAVIDTSGYAPGHVKQACELLRDAVEHYLFVSTVSVYSDASAANVDESTPTGQPTEDAIAAAKTIREATAHYGPMKAECERVAERLMPGRVTVVRPGLIVGPEDTSDRFTYWPARVSRGGEVLAPGDAAAEVQFVDVRDLGAWCFSLVVARTLGTYNAVGFRGRVSLGDLLAACRLTANTEAALTWVAEDFLLANKVRPYTDLPLWLPQGQRGHFDNRKAIAAGLPFRPVVETIRDTLAWHRTRPADYRWRAGLTPERESELLKSWASRPR